MIQIQRKSPVTTLFLGKAKINLTWFGLTPISQYLSFFLTLAITFLLRHLLTTEDLFNGLKYSGTQGYLYLKILPHKKSMGKGQPFKWNSATETGISCAKEGSPSTYTVCKNSLKTDLKIDFKSKKF